MAANAAGRIKMKDQSNLNCPVLTIDHLAAAQAGAKVRRNERVSNQGLEQSIQLPK